MDLESMPPVAVGCPTFEKLMEEILSSPEARTKAEDFFGQLIKGAIERRNVDFGISSLIPGR